MVLIAPGITRFAVNGVIDEQPTVNILDMQVDTTGSFTTRADANFAVAGDILNNWDDHIMPFITAQWTAQSVSWLDLDSANGDLGERQTTSAETWPKAGGGAGAPMPGGVAYLVRKQIVGTRGRRSGRMYVPGVTEDATAATSVNTLLGTVQTNMNAALALFLSGINDLGVDPQRQLVVVHTSVTENPDGSTTITYNGNTEVDSLLVDPTLATQRRRQR